jgi:arylsulfatase A-like enzyme
MVRTREWKFIDNPVATMQDELYSLKNDPQEQDNLILKNIEVAKNLQQRLLEWKKNLPNYTDKARQQFLPYIDKETQERIRKTGYW